MGVFNTGIFNAPRYSAFPHQHSNKVSMKSGQIKPINTVFLNTGDRYDGVDVSAIVRNAPMLAPTLDTYRLDIHTFAVRLRSIGNASRNPWTYEDFFNLNKNTDGSLHLPSIPLGQIFAANGLRTGTLFESLGFPTFKADREKYLEFLRNHHPYLWDAVAKPMVGVDYAEVALYPSSMVGVSTNTVGFPVFYWNSYSPGSMEYNSFNKYALSGYDFSNDFTDPDSNVLVFPYSGSLVRYICSKYPSVVPQSNGNVVLSTLSLVGGSVVHQGAVTTTKLANDLLNTFTFNVLDRLYEVYKIDSVSILKEYEDWLLSGFLALRSGSSFTTGFSQHYYDTLAGYSYYADSVFALLRNRLIDSYPDAPRIVFNEQDAVYDIAVPVYFFEAYWKIISDWYINTAVDSPDTFFNTFKLPDYYTDGWQTSACFKLQQVNKLFQRLWANDYFTSSFGSPQAGQAVGIPINGTIVDLRNANAMQKLKERLLYAGSRFRDVMYAITGKRTSAAILEMSEVIGECSLTINVDSVLQNSQSNNGKPLADYGGTGLGYRAGSKRVNYYAEEPTVIFVVASIVPQASYFQGLPRKFMRSNVYDYAIPQLANVGEQEVYMGELYVGSDLLSTRERNIFGYQRRNGDFMWIPNEVHGEFQTTLDFWHNSRIFGSKPALSREFLAVDAEADNLNRIFAIKSDSVDHFYCRFDFGGQIIRSLPKHVHYDL